MFPTKESTNKKNAEDESMCYLHCLVAKVRANRTSLTFS